MLVLPSGKLFFIQVCVLFLMVSVKQSCRYCASDNDRVLAQELISVKQKVIYVRGSFYLTYRSIPICDVVGVMLGQF
jgi:hypothetical protein